MKASRRSAKEVLFPETAVGGFSRVDGTIAFFTRVNSLLRPEMTVVDFGAGRGAAALDDSVPYRRELRTLRGKVRRVIGIDIDPIVKQNTTLDEARVIEVGDRLPLEDASVDLVLSDSTFEHLQDPVVVAGELTRIVKPGGWICARTANRWGYVAIGARLMPRTFHLRLLRGLQPHREPEDVFPTYYNLNTRKSIRHFFPTDV